jgi:hypothetical protein
MRLTNVNEPGRRSSRRNSNVARPSTQPCASSSAVIVAVRVAGPMRDISPTISPGPSTASSTSTPRGIDKASPRDNMDAIVALCMALERAEQPAPAPVRLVGWL